MKNELHDIGPVLFNSPQEIAERQRVFDHAQEYIANGHPKLGRNDACWCGSGKKFKKCHIQNQ